MQLSRGDLLNFKFSTLNAFVGLFTLKVYLSAQRIILNNFVLISVYLHH